MCIYKVVQIWPGLFVCKSGDISPGHIWTTLYMYFVCVRTSYTVSAFYFSEYKYIYAEVFFTKILRVVEFL